MTANRSSSPEAGVSPRPRAGLIARYCDAVDRLNAGVGWLLGPMIIFVTVAILYEVISRGVFRVGTVWVSEATVYGASAVYLLVGGFAMLHRRHVRIDLVLGALSPRLGRVLDLVTFPFLLLYAGTLMVVGFQQGWTSFLQHEGTGTPWNPAIWPVKLCIPAAGLLLILQAFSNLFRDLGLAPPAATEASLAERVAQTLSTPATPAPTPPTDRSVRS